VQRSWRRCASLPASTPLVLLPSPPSLSSHSPSPFLAPLPHRPCLRDTSRLARPPPGCSSMGSTSASCALLNRKKLLVESLQRADTVTAAAAAVQLAQLAAHHAMDCVTQSEPPSPLLSSHHPAHTEPLTQSPVSAAAAAAVLLQPLLDWLRWLRDCWLPAQQSYDLKAMGAALCAAMQDRTHQPLALHCALLWSHVLLTRLQELLVLRMRCRCCLIYGISAQCRSA
jgi:hypothetical protein